MGRGGAPGQTCTPRHSVGREFGPNMTTSQVSLKETPYDQCTNTVYAGSWSKEDSLTTPARNALTMRLWDRTCRRPSSPHTCWVGLTPGQTRVTAFGFSLPLQHAGPQGEAARLLCPHGRQRGAFLSLPLHHQQHHHHHHHHHHHQDGTPSHHDSLLY